MKVGQIGEFGLIDRIKKKVRSTSEAIRLGIDDDAAAFVPKKGMVMLLTTDVFVEGIHFDSSYATPYQIGWKAMAANLSDIAAMGGIPRTAVVSLCLPDKTDVEWVEAMYEGMEKILYRFGGYIVGGDTSAALSEIVINIALTGEVEGKQMATRSGAKVGDVICVSGDLGSSVAGLKILREQRKTGEEIPEKWSYIMERHLLPLPRIHEARVLVEETNAHAMIDISDGLASEIHHICALSGTGARIYTGEIPLHSQTKLAAQEFGTPSHHYALYGGEDYELLFALPQKRAEEVIDIIEGETETKISTVGAIVEAHCGITLIDENGDQESLPFRGYNHFSKKMVRRKIS
ncbi:MAG: thiamine-phosphate kinase [Gemmatimonadota bacterium]|nr:MAG: thiamine-phosphate kinase [Gemmatimonadota bacterium]